jgi:hypothetical protein
MYEGIARWPCFVHHAKQKKSAFIPCDSRRIFFAKAGIKKHGGLEVPAGASQFTWIELDVSQTPHAQQYASW